MKALGVTAGLVLLLITGIFVWALANGSPMSGEPSAFMQIDKSAKYAGTARPASVGLQPQEKPSAGQVQVVLDVTPKGQRNFRQERMAPGPRGHGLIEASKFGPLPQRAKDGRSPASAYAMRKAKRSDGLPRIAILVTGLGLNQRLSQHVVKKLPAEVTLAFSAYGRKLPQLVDMARSRGHELMLQVPLEPRDYPESDTGPKTLLAAHTMEQNRPHLNWALGRFTGYFGVVNNKGGRFLSSKSAVGGLFKELQRRGLVFFRDKASGNSKLSRLADKVGLGYVQATLEIDRKPSPQGISQALLKLEAVARRSGLAVGVAHMHPVSIDMISKWSKEMASRGLVLVPVSAAFKQQQGL